MSKLEITVCDQCKKETRSKPCFLNYHVDLVDEDHGAAWDFCRTLCLLRWAQNQRRAELACKITPSEVAPSIVVTGGLLTGPGDAPAEAPMTAIEGPPIFPLVTIEELLSSTPPTSPAAEQPPPRRRGRPRNAPAAVSPDLGPKIDWSSSPGECPHCEGEFLMSALGDKGDGKGLRPVCPHCFEPLEKTPA